MGNEQTSGANIKRNISYFVVDDHSGDAGVSSPVQALDPNLVRDDNGDLGPGHLLSALSFVDETLEVGAATRDEHSNLLLLERRRDRDPYIGQAHRRAPIKHRSQYPQNEDPATV